MHANRWTCSGKKEINAKLVKPPKAANIIITIKKNDTYMNKPIRRKLPPTTANIVKKIGRRLPPDAASIIKKKKEMTQNIF